MARTESEEGIAGFQPGDHPCFLYQSEEEHRAVVTAFLREGLLRGQKVIYLPDAHTREDILRCLRDAGLAPESYLKMGQLSILTAEQAYLRGGFRPDEAVAWQSDETERALQEGYSALRTTAEVSWALATPEAVGRLAEYEAKLSEMLPGKKCLHMCQYDRRRFEPEVLLDALSTHRIAVVGTEVYDNFYYMPPAEFLRADLPAARLERRLANLAARKQAEEAVRKSEQRLAEAQRVAHMGNWDWNILTNDLYWSDEIYRIFGLQPQEFGATYPAFLERVHPDDRQHVESAVQRAVEEREEYSIDHRIVLPSGEVRTVHEEGEVTYDQAGRPIRMVGTVLDITDRKRAEEAVKEERDRAQKYLDVAGVIIVALDSNGNVTLINKKGCEVLGYGATEITGKNWFDVALPRHVRAGVKEVFGRLMAGEVEPVTDYENPVLTRWGEERLVAWHNTLLTEAQGKIIGTLSSGMDITDRKRAEQRLAESQQQLRAVFDSVDDGILLADAVTKQIIMANKAASEMLGYGQQELVTMVITEIHPEEHMSHVLRQFEGRRRGEFAVSKEIPFMRKDGEVVYCEVNGAQVVIGGRPALMEVVRRVSRTDREEEPAGA